MSPVSRRELLLGGAAAGAGLVIGIYGPRLGSLGMLGGKKEFSPNAYLHILPDNTVTIIVARSEMGQGVRTALPMILAEELEADWDRVKIEQAGASTLFGDQTTGGSASVRLTWDPMRKAGAQAREMLLAAAAQRWSVPVAECKAEKGSIKHEKSGRVATYGDLADAAGKLPIPSDPPLKKPEDYKIVGTHVLRLDTPSKTDGSAQYGIDVQREGMKIAVLARAPVIGGKVASFDDADAKKVEGVRQVSQIGDSAVAVIADTTWAAMEGRRALKVTWDDGPNKDLSTAAIWDGLKQSADKKDKKAVTLYSTGDVAKAGGRTVEATYQLPFLAHAPMEPGNTTAIVAHGGCELWSPTQVPQDVRDSVAAALNLPADKVKVNVTLLGGGFGRRLEHDYGVEAALVAQTMPGTPVKVVWTREDDMQHSPYRPPSLHLLSAKLDGSGWPIAFHHKVVAPGISSQKGFPLTNGIDPDIYTEGAFLYPIANILIEHVPTETPVPLAWLRSVWDMQFGFATEAFLDEVAAAGGKDPLELRLHLLREDKEIRFADDHWKTARLRGVLQLVAEKSDWHKPLPAGMYRGIACWGCFNTYAAEVVELTMEGDQPKVHRVVAAVDCGTVVNPNILEQQMHSGVVFGLSAALRGKITIEQGRVQQANFDDYEPLRMNEFPKVETYWVKNTEPPSGIGEPTVPPVSPALCNAIYSATKKRIRILPVQG